MVCCVLSYFLKVVTFRNVLYVIFKITNIISRRDIWHELNDEALCMCYAETRAALTGPTSLRYNNEAQRSFYLNQRNFTAIIFKVASNRA